MAKSISENNSRDLWKEVYKVKSKSNTGSQCMDQATGNESISELFAHRYNALYNSVCYNIIQLTILIVLCYYWMPPKRLTELNMSVYLSFYETEICVQLFYDSLLLCIYLRRCK